MSELFDVIEVEIAAPHRVRVIDTLKSFRNAEAGVGMAVFRRGVDTHYFKKCAAGTYRDGDTLHSEFPDVMTP